jgi:RNase P/RNase MRP subunit p29
MGTLDTDHATSFALLRKSALMPFKQKKANTRQIEGRVLVSLPEDGGQSKTAQVFKTTRAR